MSKEFGRHLVPIETLSRGLKNLGILIIVLGTWYLVLNSVFMMRYKVGMFLEISLID